MPGMSKIDMKYCTGCGAPIENAVRQRFCPYCGSKDEGKKFCAECGASLLDLATTTVAPQTSIPTMVQTPSAPVVQNVIPQASVATTQPAQTQQGQPTWTGQQATQAKLAKAYCPDCGNEATWVSAYSQWYCYTDQKYVSQPSYTEPRKGLFRR